MRKLFQALLFGVFLTAGAAQAATTATTVSANTTVDPACQVVTAQTLAFGAYDAVSTNKTVAKTGTMYMDIQCIQGTPVRVAFDQGQNAGTGSSCTTPVRRMLGTNGDYLTYQIYGDSGRTQVRGCATGSNDLAISGSVFTSSTSSYRVTHYGSIPAGQNIRASTYRDTVGFTVTF